MTVRSTEEEVAAVIAAYGAASRSQDLDGYLALFRDDAIQCGNGTPPRVGKAAIREARLRLREGRDMSGELAFEIVPEHIDVLGDMAVVIAHPTMGEPAPADLTALFVLRQTDGDWLIWRQSVTRRD